MNKIDAYKDLFASLATSKDIAGDANALLDLVTKDLDEGAALATKCTEQEKKIKDLQDTNMKLFLSQVKPEEKHEQEQEEEEKPLSFDDFSKNL